MRSRADNRYGIIPKKWVAMLSADGTSWFAKHGEVSVCIKHQRVTRRQKTPPPMYEDAINEAQEGVLEDEDVVTKPIESDEQVVEESVDLLAAENVEEVTIVLTVLCRPERIGRVWRDFFGITAMAQVEHSRHTFH